MGTVYGVSQSAAAGGNAAGAVLATLVASVIGIPSTFLLAGALALATGTLATVARRRDATHSPH
jgi:predicted MFS family arabinose efflux permease